MLEPNELINLILSLDKSPKNMNILELEISNYVNSNDSSLIYQLFSNDSPRVIFFALKILDLTIERKLRVNDDINAEIELMNQIVNNYKEGNVVEVYSKLGLYCWPMKMTNFIDVIWSNLNNEFGYKLFHSFLNKINNSSKIDSCRRTELKKSVRFIIPDFLSKMDEKFSNFIILIMIELLTIVHKDFDYSIVYKKAKDHPHTAAQFFVKSVSILGIKPICSILPEYPINEQTAQVINAGTRSYDPVVAEYMFRCISDKNTFPIATSYWQKIFSSNVPETSNVIIVVLQTIISNYYSLKKCMPEDEDNEYKVGVIGVINAVSHTYPNEAIQFIIGNSEMIGNRFSMVFINKLAKVNPNALIELLRENNGLKNSYLIGSLMYLLKDPKTPEIITKLDLREKDCIKLCLQIIERYEEGLPETFLKEFLREVSYYKNTEEIQVLINKRLNCHLSFEDINNWDDRKAILYYYCLKSNKEYYSRFSDQFYIYCDKALPFDRCFATAHLLNNYSMKYLEKIYTTFHNFPLPDMNCFNSDLLLHLDTPYLLHFINMEVQYFVSRWESFFTADYDNFCLAVKSLITLIFNTVPKNPNYLDHLICLLVIEDSILITKILNLFASDQNFQNGGNYQTDRCIYNLMMVYTSYELVEQHSLALNCIAKCLMKTDGPECFSKILGGTLEHWSCLKQSMVKENKKGANNMLKKVLKEFKAIPMSQLSSISDFKVTNQNIFTEPDQSNSGPSYSNYFK